MENAVIRFRKLSFGVPGTDLELAGAYNLDTDAVTFSGAIKAQATVSQMVTGWKRLVLKPLDRVFEKDGAGVYLPVQIEGTSEAPLRVTILGRQVTVPAPKH